MKKCAGEYLSAHFSLCNIVSITHSKNRPLQASDFSSLYHDSHLWCLPLLSQLS